MFVIKLEAKTLSDLKVFLNRATLTVNENPALNEVLKAVYTATEIIEPLTEGGAGK